MILIALFLVCVLWFCIILFVDRRQAWRKKNSDGRGYHSDTDWEAGYIASCMVGVVILVISVIINFIMIDFQYEDYEKITEKTQNIQLFEEKKDLLVSEFSIILAEYYPEHEKDIFNSMSGKDIKLYLVKYPEIRTIEGLSLLVDEIDTLNSDMYNEMMARNSVCKNIRYRFNSVACIGALIPSVPSHHYDAVYSGQQ